MYMAPELCRSEKYGQKADIWALGCVLYELLTLKPAFMASSVNGLMLRIRCGQYQRVLPTAYTDDLKALVHQLLKPKPEQRPSMSDLARLPLLAAHLRPEASETTPETENRVVAAPAAPAPTAPIEPAPRGRLPAIKEVKEQRSRSNSPAILPEARANAPAVRTPLAPHPPKQPRVKYAPRLQELMNPNKAPRRSLTPEPPPARRPRAAPLQGRRPLMPAPYGQQLPPVVGAAPRRRLYGLR